MADQLKTANFALRSDIKTAWLEALRSGEYKQGYGYLYDERENSFCCLGVLCRVKHPEDDLDKIDMYAMPAEIYKEFQFEDADWGLKCKVDGEMEDLAELNDHGRTFLAIADIIERAVPTFTTDPNILTWPKEG